MTQFTRTAKPIASHVSNNSISVLYRFYGDYLEKLTPQQRCIMGSALLDHIANENQYYTMRDSLSNLDPDHLLDRDMRNTLVEIADESYPVELAGLSVAISALVLDDARNGTWD